MALDVRSLQKRLRGIPDYANIYWYTEGDKVQLRAEWSTEDQEFVTAEIAEYSAIQTGGPVQ